MWGIVRQHFRDIIEKAQQLAKQASIGPSMRLISLDSWIITPVKVIFPMQKTFGSDIYNFLLLRTPEMKVQRQYMEAKGVQYDSHATPKDKKKLTLALDFVMPKA